jgi:uncharacterized damage-inducible protein DinB
MNNKYFIDLLNYDRWANTILSGFLKDNSITGGRELELFSHIFNAEIIWFKRVQGDKEFPYHMEIHTPEECDMLMNTINRDWMDLIGSSDEKLLTGIIEYKNIKGEQMKSTVWEILTHMINHSSYHRAQIALLIRQKGMNPPATDYIGYSRQRNYED